MGEGKGHEDTPRQAKQILMWGPTIGVFFSLRARAAGPAFNARLFDHRSIASVPPPQVSGPTYNCIVSLVASLFGPNVKAFSAIPPQ